MSLRTIGAGLAASALLCACGGSPTGTSRAGSTGHAPTVTVTRTVTETVTAPTPSGAPTTATPTATGACTPRQLGIHYVNSRGAAGTAYEEFAFVNVSTSPCSLQGYPGVSLVLTSGKIVDIANTRDPARPPKPVSLVSGGQATFVVGIHGDAAYPCVQITHFRFIPPGGTAYEQIAHADQVCGGSVVVSSVGYGNA
jgi:hypothetical protein